MHTSIYTETNVVYLLVKLPPFNPLHLQIAKKHIHTTLKDPDFYHRSNQISMDIIKGHIITWPPLSNRHHSTDGFLFGNLQIFTWNTKHDFEEIPHHIIPNLQMKHDVMIWKNLFCLLGPELQNYITVWYISFKYKSRCFHLLNSWKSTIPQGI